MKAWHELDTRTPARRGPNVIQDTLPVAILERLAARSGAAPYRNLAMNTRFRRFTPASLVLFALAFAALSSPASALSDAREALFAAHQRMLDSKVSTETVTTDKKGRETRVRTEFDTLSRVRVTSDDMSLVILPEGTWMRSGNGEWTRPPIDMSKMFKQVIPATLEEAKAGTRNIRDLGERNVDGQTLRAISYDVETRIMGITMASSNTVYIDAGGRIVRSESEGTAMGQTTRSVQTIRYDDSIRISAPN